MSAGFEHGLFSLSQRHTTGCAMVASFRPGKGSASVLGSDKADLLGSACANTGRWEDIAEHIGHTTETIAEYCANFVPDAGVMDVLAAHSPAELIAKAKQGQFAATFPGLGDQLFIVTAKPEYGECLFTADVGAYGLAICTCQEAGCNGQAALEFIVNPELGPMRLLQFLDGSLTSLADEINAVVPGLFDASGRINSAAVGDFTEADVDTIMQIDGVADKTNKDELWGIVQDYARLNAAITEATATASPSPAPTAGQSPAPTASPSPTPTTGPSPASTITAGEPPTSAPTATTPPPGSAPPSSSPPAPPPSPATTVPGPAPQTTPAAPSAAPSFATRAPASLTLTIGDIDLESLDEQEAGLLKDSIANAVVQQSRGAITRGDIVDIILATIGASARHRTARGAASGVEAEVIFSSAVTNSVAGTVEATLADAIANGGVAVEVTVQGVATQVAVTDVQANQSASNPAGSGSSDSFDSALAAGIAVGATAVLALAAFAAAVSRRQAKRAVDPHRRRPSAAAAVAAEAGNAAAPVAIPAAPIAVAVPIVSVEVEPTPEDRAEPGCDDSTGVVDNTAAAGTDGGGDADGRRKSSVISTQVVRSSTPEVTAQDAPREQLPGSPTD